MEDNEIVNQTAQAISILNQLEDYFDTLDDEMSNCDKEISDYEHLIENSKLEEFNLSLIYENMKSIFQKRRKIKKDKLLSVYFLQNSGKLNQKNNREIFLQGLKNTQKNLVTEYKNRILTVDEIEKITKKETKKRGRPKKVKEGDTDGCDTIY